MSIRKKLTLLMIFIGLLPTLAVSIFAYIAISNGLTARTADQLAGVATKQEQKINGLLQGRQEEAVELSNKFDVQKSLGDYLAVGGEQNRERLNMILMDKKVSAPDIQTIYLADISGKVIASTQRASEGSHVAAEDTDMAANQETNTTVRKDARDGINKLYITTKINVNKKESGYVSVIFRIDDIVAAVQDYTSLGATGETVVAQKNAQGSAVSLFPLRFDTDAALRADLNTLGLFNAGPAVYERPADYRGQHVLVAARSVGFADWIIATKIDAQEALAQIDQLRSALAVIVVLSSMAIMLIALYLTHLFIKPILHIARTAQRIGEGDLSARTNMARNDEIGVLGSSIDSMGSSLAGFVSRIEEQRHRLEVILNSITEGILAIDKQGTIVIANQAAATLSKRGMTQLIGQNVRDIFVWRRDGTPQAIDYGQTGPYDGLAYTDNEGTIHYIKIIVAQVSGEQEQKTAQTIITIHDETKSRELEAMKVDFVSMAAHELRTPLAAIRGYLELITFERDNASKDKQDYLKKALKSTAELGGLINNLLDVTRIERGTLSFSLEKTDIAVDVKQAVQDAQFSAKEKRISLTYEGPAEGCFVAADQIALHEVLNNLITNAIKYTDAKGKITVSVTQKDEHYVVNVKDTGVGIPKAAQANLFTKFYRVHGGLNSGSTGTGLGLFISKSIIERHNGAIGVVSEEGVGSTFTFSIPRFNEAASAGLSTADQPKIIASRRRHGWTTKNITR